MISIVSSMPDLQPKLPSEDYEPLDILERLSVEIRRVLECYGISSAYSVGSISRVGLSLCKSPSRYWFVTEADGNRVRLLGVFCTINAAGEYFVNQILAHHGVAGGGRTV